MKCSQYRLEYQRTYYASLRAQGLCLYCRRPLEGKNTAYLRCSNCRAKIANQRLKRRNFLREQGLCICGQPIAVGNRVCEDCWFKEISKGNTGTPKNWLIIKEILLRQNYECAYTGKKLVIGVNASIDHIVPTTKGGNNFIENLQWVDIKINRMKNDMSHQEFISTIKLILSRQTLQEVTYAVAQNVSWED